MIKAIFLDIDGTMVSFDTHRMPEDTASALCEARRRGVKLFVATGRQRGDIHNLGDMEFDGYITLNGSCCWVGDEEIFRKSIPKEDIAAFVRYQEENGVIPCFFVEADAISANTRADVMERMRELICFPPRPVVSMDELMRREIYQLTAFFSEEAEPEVMRQMPHCTATRWFPTFADVVAKGVEKAVGLQVIGAYFGIRPEEMMAVGDGGNDISMLRYAGVGVAMGNSDETVKQAADYVTSAVDDGGVARALHHFGII